MSPLLFQLSYSGNRLKIERFAILIDWMIYIVYYFSTEQRLTAQ
jgi:hypothetical protein